MTKAAPASNSSVKSWLKTARPFTLSATVSPVLVGTAVAAFQGKFNFWIFLAVLISGLFLQIGANYFNEFFDYHYGLDSAQSLGASTVIFKGSMTAKQVLAGGIVSFTIAALLGVVLIILVSPTIILFGLAGIAIAYFYSSKPVQFSARGLGDIMVFIAMGFLMTWGAYYVQIHEWSWTAFSASVPVGFLVTAILNMNNTRDYEDDKAVNKKTLPVRLGQRFGQLFHATLLYGAYATVIFFAFTHQLPYWSLITLLTFPLAYINVRGVMEATDPTGFAVAIKRTAMLHLIFGVVLAVGIVVAKLTHAAL
jgi:1,4-dihydroxy-2-naphthoate polyprenyltransferase